MSDLNSGKDTNQFQHVNDEERTNKAILDQLVYIDNFIGEDNEGKFDLSAFADESFVFADEDKPNNDEINAMFNEESNDINGNNNGNNHNINGKNQETGNDSLHGVQLNNLPRFPVPPGAKTSLQAAGLNQNQIDFLSALIAQHQLLQQMNGGKSHTNTEREYSTNVSGDATSQLLFAAEGEIESTSSQHPTQFQVPTLQGESSEATGNETNLSETELYKRRRSTAASARFRIKKKLKEKEMEEKIESLEELIKNFEGKIKTLELENKLLKNLIIEKGSEKTDQELKKFKERILNRTDD